MSSQEQPPDPDLEIHVGPDGRYSGKTETKNNTINPYWNDTVVTNVPARAFLTRATYQIWDSDTFSTDRMLNCIADITPAHFGITFQLTCHKNSGTERELEGTVMFKLTPH